MKDGQPLALLLIPRTLEYFILRDQAQDLLRAPGVVAAEPPTVPYGVLPMPHWLGSALALGQARRLKLPAAGQGRRHLPPGPVAARARPARRQRGNELWYGCWDRYDHAYDASGARRRGWPRSTGCRGARGADLRRLGRLAGSSARRAASAALVPLSADSFPAPDPDGAAVAVSLGHLGWRTDWALLRAVAEQMPELVLLLIGAWHDDESGDDPDYAALPRGAEPPLARRRTDDEAARLILCADVGHRPVQGRAVQRRGAALPDPEVRPPRPAHRLPAARGRGDVGGGGHARPTRRPGSRRCARTRGADAPRPELRDWALAQTALRQNAPLWERLQELGVVQRRSSWRRVRAQGRGT